MVGTGVPVFETGALERPPVAPQRLFPEREGRHHSLRTNPSLWLPLFCCWRVRGNLHCRSANPVDEYPPDGTERWTRPWACSRARGTDAIPSTPMDRTMATLPREDHIRVRCRTSVVVEGERLGEASDMFFSDCDR
jgi:hypothetical protein